MRLVFSKRPSNLKRTSVFSMKRLLSRNMSVPEETRDQKLVRAKGYPYSRPTSSFLYASGAAIPFRNELWKGPEYLKELLETISPHSDFDLKEYTNTEWHAVLAIGSNASPEQLYRKYSQQGVIIPVIQSVLFDFDVVYAPLVSSYGSCTATLQASKGTVVELFVTYLTTPLLDQMIETEGAYDLVKVSNIELHVGHSLKDYNDGNNNYVSLDPVLQFNHQNGVPHIPLNESEMSGHSPISLKAIPAVNRKYPALDQVEMLTCIKQLNGDEEIELDQWIMTNLTDREFRKKVVRMLTSLSQPFRYEDVEFLLRIGDVHSNNIA
eukprot:g5336.t1